MTRFSLTLSFAGIWLVSGCGARTSDDDLLLGRSVGVGGNGAGGDIIGDGDTGGRASGGRASGGSESGGTGGGAVGSCCISTDEAGCADPGIEQCVCAFDEFCCQQSWDQACVDEAENFCEAGCTLPPTGGTGGTLTGGTGGVITGGTGGVVTGGTGGTTTGGTGGVTPGNCCDSHGGTGCQNPAVQACVCDIDPFCCDTNWDAICVNRVTNECGVECRDTGTGGTGGMPTGGTGGTGGSPSGGTGGVINQCEEIFDDECGVCMCNNCFDELDTCLGDFGCLAVVNCIGETGCFGLDCYQPDTCQGVIDLFGGLGSSSTQNALALGFCTAASGCACD